MAHRWADQPRRRWSLLILARLSLLVLFAGLAACSASPKPNVKATATAARVVPSVAPAPERATITIDADPDGDDRIRAELRLEGSLARTQAFSFRPRHPVTITTITAADADGKVDVRSSSEGPATRFELVRVPRGPLVVRYAAAFGRTPEDATTPTTEPIEFRAGGDDLLVLPEIDEPIAVVLHLRTGGIATGAASSFGLGVDQRVRARPAELRAAFYLAGGVGTASFHAVDGDDIAGWVGHTAFDPRWVSAELAATRSAVDAWVGRTRGSGAPPEAFLIAATKRDEPPIMVVQRLRGLFISADRRGAWTPAVRILAAQALARRYIGGFLWVGDRNDDASGQFFSEGFSRAIARELLFDAGMISASDRAAELDALLSAIAFAKEPLQVATARGALVATALDVALAKGPNKNASLQHFIRERLADAATRNVDVISRTDFVANVRDAAGDAFAAAMTATLDRGAEVPLPVGLAGPCYRLVSADLVPFELGFVTSRDAELVVTSVVPKSRAAAAGVTVGDIVTDLHYERGKARVPVTGILVRGSRKIPLRFMPAGVARRGRMFERVPNIPDDRC